jgi:CheY-like chemotaxis protein
VNIVAVDDEQDFRRILKKKISNLGHASVIAVNG